MNIPDPIEQMDARMERAIEAQVVGDKIRCCECGELCHPADVMAATSDPGSPAICMLCLDSAT